ncbi:MAG TPA: tetratricopeptide repeat protein [Ktedonosporobacter sp.]|nr:tetratricopeptide repeat protein [Ktedonosporobacter sp.]
MLAEDSGIKLYTTQEEFTLTKTICEPPLSRWAYTTYPPEERPWTVPYQRNDSFSESWHLITYLHHVFRNKIWDAQTQGRPDEPAPTTPLYTHIRGQHGSGKTQHAIEYAYRYRAEYDSVFWVNAASRQSLALSFYDIAYALALPERFSPIQDHVIAAVLHWLHIHDQWLLIIDNINMLEQVRTILPRKGQGHILLLLHTPIEDTAEHKVARRDDLQTSISTRSIAGGSNLHWLEPRQCQQFLLQRTTAGTAVTPLKLLPLEARQALRSLVTTIGRLPLVLDMAGAYIEHTQCSLREYQQHYQAQRPRPLKREQSDKDYDRAAHTAVRTALARLQANSPLAVELLRLCAFLHPDAIAQEILVASNPEPPARTYTNLKETLEVNQAIAMLQQYALISSLPGHARMLSIHRLTQVALKAEMSRDQQGMYARRVVRAISLLIPTMYDEQQRPLFARYLLHAQICAVLIKEWEITTPEAVDLLQRIGIYLQYHATYQEAEPLLQQACLLAEQVYGPVHEKVGILLGNLADLYATCENPERVEYAEELYLRSIDIFDATIGPDQHRAVVGLTNLAHLYKHQGKAQRAEELLRRALTIAEDFLGLDHHLLAFNITNLAQFYSEQNKPHLARPLYERVISLLEKKYGAHDLVVAQALNNLAHYYMKFDQPEQALPLLQRVLLIADSEDESDPIIVAQSLCNLAQLAMQLGQLDEAEPLLQRSLAIHEHVFGANHPELRGILIQLSVLYTDMGKYNQANEILQRTLVTWQEELSASAPITLLLETEPLQVKHPSPF